MPSRPIWKGFVQFSLVSIPVHAYTATDAEGGRPALNQLHRDCNSRIRYRKTCPIHGEVPADQIVSGYQFGAGQYVVIEPDELDRIRSPKEKAFNIESFIDTAAVDPAYFSGRIWYLLPEGKAGMKPFVLLRRAMQEAGRVGCSASLGAAPLLSPSPVERPLLTRLAFPLLQHHERPEQRGDPHHPQPSGDEDHFQRVMFTG